jgi:predicted PurR-regulated permease PerM
MIFQIVPVAEASVVTLMKSVDKVIINPLIMLLFALAMVYFLYGLARYLMSPDNEEVRKSSKTHMLWGIIGMFIMVSVFGIMSILLSTVGETNIQLDSTGNYTVGDMK